MLDVSHSLVRRFQECLYISNACTNSTCVKEPSVYDKHRPPSNHLQGILCVLNYLYIFGRVYIVLKFNTYDQLHSTLLLDLYYPHLQRCWKRDKYYCPYMFFLLFMSYCFQFLNLSLTCPN